jgi:D-psicose/D-tagatose/L-ribulose 3-epimerase
LKQNFELKSDKIRTHFLELKQSNPDTLEHDLNLSWSNWGFGLESLDDSMRRLHDSDVRYIELHGNHYGSDLGYKAGNVQTLMEIYGMEVSGICGMFSKDNDLSSNSAIQRQAAIDYLKRELEFAATVGAGYILVVPGAVGRPSAYDESEFERSVETLYRVGDLFVQYGIKAAIEPIRSAEVSFIHTIKDAKRYIQAVNHPGIQHINGDVYHMQSEEEHVGEAILEAGLRLVNLHLADSNRGALGQGAMDLDTIIMSLYLLRYNTQGKYATPEPLGPGGAPYPAMYGKPDKESLDRLVMNSITCFREREAIIKQIF